MMEWLLGNLGPVVGAGIVLFLDLLWWIRD